jgi:GT2 family glycosyltransferase
MEKLKNNPVVFIGMPVYNGGKFIKGAIESILAQSFRDFVIVISDNDSSDDTAIISSRFVEVDNRVRYVRQTKNIGSLENFKLLLKMADTEFFIWAAHDDRWEPSFLEETVSVLRHYPAVGLCFTGMKIRDLKTGEEISYLTGFTTQKRSWLRFFFRCIQDSSNLIYGLHRTHLLKRFPLERYDYCDVFMTRWYEVESRIAVVPKPLFISGTEGRRTPYSVTGVKIDPVGFRTAERKLLKRHFPLAWPFFYFFSYLCFISYRK